MSNKMLKPMKTIPFEFLFSILKVAPIMFEMSHGDTNDKMMLLFENKKEREWKREGERERLSVCVSASR